MDFEVSQWKLNDTGLMCVVGPWHGKTRAELWPNWEIEPVLRTMVDVIDVPIPGTTRRIRWSLDQVTPLHLVAITYSLPKIIPMNSSTDRSIDILMGLQRELRRPLDRIISTTELFMNTELTPEQFEYVDATRNASYDLVGIVNDVVDYTRLRSGKVELAPVATSPRDLIASSYEIATSRSDARNVKVSVFLEPEIPPMISIDSRLLQQVLVNILHNGVKYVKPGTLSNLRIEVRKVSLVTTPKGKKVSARRSNRLRSNSLTSINEEMVLEFKISDNGIGIGKPEQGKLFDSFTRLEGSSGAGLGLTLCKLIVELMGGTITVESSPNQGSTFTFTVSTVEAKIVSPKELTLRHLEGRSMLILDPNPSSRLDLISLMLESKVRAIGVETREEGLLHLGVTRFDLILMDTSISPLPDDVDAIIIVMGSANSEPKARGILPKPVSPNRLLTLCAELLSVPEKARFPLNSRILIIDGSIPHLRLIKGILSKLGYVYVDSSNHGLEALDRLANERYHLVIFGDMKIPKKDAKSITKALEKAYSGKNRPHRPKTLLVMDTSTGSKDSLANPSVKKRDSFLDLKGKLGKTESKTEAKLGDKYEGLFDGYIAKPLFLESFQAILADIYSQ